VDDGSTDATLEKVTALKKRFSKKGRKLQIKPLPENHGKGHAVRKGFQEADGDVIALFDADLEYDPLDFKPMLELIADGRADAVYGSRFCGGGMRRVTGAVFYWGNRLLTGFTNLLYNVSLTDMETCLKMIKRELLESLDLKGSSFDIEPEITAKLCRSGIRIYEVPISYHGRTRAEGKKIHWYHGLQAVWVLLKFRFWTAEDRGE
jgi:glycosyltransferase involved in cell wall biosynthesis